MSAAAENGEFEMLRFLVEEHRLDIDEMYICRYNEYPGESDGTALHKAAERGDINIAACLLEKGARSEARDPANRTPLMRAKEKNQEAMIKFLESKK